MSSWFEKLADNDFTKARNKELLSSISKLMHPDRSKLLPLDAVLALLQPKSETYIGLEAIPVNKIIGSEGRYRDFNRHFLPKKDFLRSRWTKIDLAHYEEINLPPVRIYEIGGAYFVRDGNHRVSVARMRGQTMIDAEVTRLSAQVQLYPNMTLVELRNQLISYEKSQFYQTNNFLELTHDPHLDFTSPGRYDSIVEHIHAHKYFINQSQQAEIPFTIALQSWHNNVYKPIVQCVLAKGLLSRFPERTASDLYLYIVQHWDQLKKKYGLTYSLQAATQDFDSHFGIPLLQRYKNKCKKIWHTIRSFFRPGNTS